MLATNRFVFLILILSQLNCQNPGKLHVVTDMPVSLKEESGIVAFDKTSVWIVEDSGNHDKIYKVDFNGDILKEFKVKNAKNTDWEDLTKDKKGNLYIGDFGNNYNIRKDLTILSYPILTWKKGIKLMRRK